MNSQKIAKSSNIFEVFVHPKVTRDELIKLMDKMLVNVYGCAGCGLNGHDLLIRPGDQELVKFTEQAQQVINSNPAVLSVSNLSFQTNLGNAGGITHG